MITTRSPCTRNAITFFHSIPSSASALSTGLHASLFRRASLLSPATEKLCRHLKAGGHSLNEQMAFVVQQGLDPPQ
jgi:hypothetical protein